MTKNVVGLFDTSTDAQAALQDLRSSGFTQDQVSFVANNSSGEYDQYGSDAGGSAAAEGAGAGATTGTVVGGIGGVLAGLGLFLIPGIGPIAGAGTLAAVLGAGAAGAGIGAAAGGLLGALVGAGIPEDDANIYQEGVRGGGTLLMVQAEDNQVDRAVDILNRHNVVDIDERGSQYSSGGSMASTTGGEYRDSTMGGSDMGGGSYADSSKLGTATGGVAGAATGAAIGSVGGPIGTVIGGVAGALAGGGVGAAGDAVGAEATDGDSGMSSTSGSMMGSGSTPMVQTNYGGSTGGSGTDADGSYADSSKIGTAAGGLTGAATGAAIGSVGGPIGTVIGGVAGALTGGGVGAAGDAAGAAATDDMSGGSMANPSMAAGTAYGSATDIGTTSTNVNTNYTTGTTGMTGGTMNTGMNTGSTMNTGTTSTVNAGDTIAVPIVEEQLRVGKREVERGRVRVYTHITETPVEQQVTLREEHVEVQRRPVNRAVTSADLAGLQEGTIEIRESAEEVVTSKEARVVEEVVISKEATQHTETVRDTVRRTDVDVQQVPGQTTTTGYTTTSTTDTSMGTTGSMGTSGSTGRSITDRIEDATNTDLNRDGGVGGSRI